MTRSLTVLVLAVLPAAASAGSSPDWDDVRAVFDKRCVMCHSDKGAGLGLRLDGYAFALSGSTRGPVVLAGDPDNSEMVRRLRGQSTPRMPFLSVPLPPEELDLIVRWIAAGMPGGD